MMKAEKTKVTITFEVLSDGSIPGMAQEVLNQMTNEVANGTLRWEDGDEVNWETTKERVII